MTGIYDQSGINYSSPGSTYSVLPIQPGTYNYAYETYNETGKVYNRSAVSASGSGSSNAVITRTNLVRNPSFETDTSNGWGAYRSVLSRVSGTFGSGSWVGQAVHNNTGIGGAFYNFTAPSAGTVVTASATLLRTVGSRSYWINYEFYNGATYLGNGGASGAASPCTTATRLSATGTVPANVTNAYIVVYSTGTGSVNDAYQIDSVLIETSPSLQPYFDGSSTSTYTNYALSIQQWNGTANGSTSTVTYRPVAHQVTQLRLDKLTDFSFPYRFGGSFYLGFATVKRSATGSGQGSESAVRKIIRVRTATGSGSGGSNNSIVHGVLRTGYGSGGATAGDQGVGLHISPRTATASGSGTSSTVSNPVRFRTATGNGNGAGAAIGLRTVITEATGSGLGTDTVTYIHVVVHIGIGSGTSSSSATALRITFASATGSGASSSSTISLEIMGRAATSAGTGSSAIVVLRVVPRTSSSQGIGGSSAVRLIVSPRTGTGSGTGTQTALGARTVRKESTGSGSGSGTANWVKSHIFRVPYTETYPAGYFGGGDAANRLRRYDRSNIRTLNLYKLNDGTYTTIEQRDLGQVAKLWHGGRDHFLNDAEVVELTEAGFGASIT